MAKQFQKLDLKTVYFWHVKIRTSIMRKGVDVKKKKREENSILVFEYTYISEEGIWFLSLLLNFL